MQRQQANSPQTEASSAGLPSAISELFRAVYLEASYQIYRRQSREGWEADRRAYEWRPYSRREIAPNLEMVMREQFINRPR